MVLHPRRQRSKALTPLCPSPGHTQVPIPAASRMGGFTLSLLMPQGGDSEAPQVEPMPVAMDAPMSKVAGSSMPWPGPSWGGDYVASTPFTVADPRPPTAELTITVPKWVSWKGWAHADSCAVSMQQHAKCPHASACTVPPCTLPWHTA